MAASTSAADSILIQFNSRRQLNFQSQPTKDESSVEKNQLLRSIRDELIKFLAKNPQSIVYNGFEPPAKMHMAQICDVMLHLVVTLLSLLTTDSTPVADSTPTADSIVNFLSDDAADKVEATSSHLLLAKSGLSIEEKYQLLRNIEDELRNLLAKNLNTIASDGFRPYGRKHIEQICEVLRLTIILLNSHIADSTPTTDSTVNFVSTDELEASSQLPPTKKVLSVEEKYQLVRTIGEECIQEDELRRLLAQKPFPIAYDGFEPSGIMHIAQGIMKVINVNKLVAAGCTVKIWIADWFAELNNKMGGDIRKIQTVGKYFIEIWKAAGMSLKNVQFLFSSQEINNNSREYWTLVKNIARANSLSRIVRCSQIMGRKDNDELAAAQIFYPCMQCADVFFLKADICQLGMDQRKVNVLAREYCDKIKRKNKPVILSHHMLPGLKEGQEKMSKSDASSSIYMEDEEAEVSLKIMEAHCPEEIVEGNPCLEYLKHIVFPWFGKIEVETAGGNKEYNSFEVLAGDYASRVLKPSDLKPALAKAINEILQPVRNHFETDSVARELLKAVKSYKVTR